MMITTITITITHTDSVCVCRLLKITRFHFLELFCYIHRMMKLNELLLIVTLAVKPSQAKPNQPPEQITSSPISPHPALSLRC